MLYVRQLFVLAIGLYTSRLTLEVLGETDFGIYAAVGGITSLMAILTTSLATGTQRFITFELGKGNIERLNRVYVTSINIHVILSIILLIVGEVAGSWFIFCKMTIPAERLWTAFYVFQFTLFNSAFTIINAPNHAEIVAHEDMGIWAFISIADSVLKLISVACLFLISWDKLLIYSFALFIIQFLQRTFCLWFCKKSYPEVKYSFIWDSVLIKDMMKIAGWSGLNNLAVTGFIQGVSILLNVFFGPVLNAAYSIAMQAYSGIRQFCSSFQLASNPQIVKLYSVGEYDRMQRLLLSVCKFSFFLIFVLSLPFLINANFVLSIWLKEVPAHTESFFILLLVYAYIDVLAYPLDIAAQATGKLKHYSITVSIIVLSTLVFAYIAYRFNAIAESIYIIAIIVSGFSLFARLFHLQRLIGLNVSSFIKTVAARIAIVAFVTFGALFVIYNISPHSTAISIAFFPISWTLAVVIVYLCGLDSGEKAFVKQAVNKISRRWL